MHLHVIKHVRVIKRRGEKKCGTAAPRRLEFVDFSDKISDVSHFQKCHQINQVKTRFGVVEQNGVIIVV